MVALLTARPLLHILLALLTVQHPLIVVVFMNRPQLNARLATQHLLLVVALFTAWPQLIVRHAAQPHVIREQPLLSPNMLVLPTLSP